MKKKLLLITLVATMLFMFTGCTEAERVSSNLSKEADSFNVVRQLTVINCITNDIIFQMTGRLSIQPDMAQRQLEIIIEYEEGKYKKDFVGLADNTTYTVDQIEPLKSDPYKYTLNFNPKMWVPVEFKTID
jgi:hypothetical protein